MCSRTNKGIDFPILNNIEDIAKRFIKRDELPDAKVDEKTLKFVEALYPLQNVKEYDSQINRTRKEMHFQPRKVSMLKHYRYYIKAQNLERNLNLEKYLTFKTTKSHSGVLVVTVLTSPGSENSFHYHSIRFSHLQSNVPLIPSRRIFLPERLSLLSR